MKTYIDRVITLLDDTSEQVPVSAGELVKLINPDGENVGGFVFSGKYLVDAILAGVVILSDVPHEDEGLFVDVNHNAGQLTNIENRGEKILGVSQFNNEEDYIFMYGSEVHTPRPFKISWPFYSTRLDKDMIVTIEFKPLPAEHALLMQYQID